MSKIVELSVLKQSIKNGEVVAGQSFVNSKGSTGTVLAGLSSHLKFQAEMTCSTEGCNETHVREQSDWHQSHQCRTHAEGIKGANPNNLGGGIRLDDGSVVRLMKVRDTDTAEVAAAKEQNNLVFEQARTARREAEKADTAARVAARKAERETKQAEVREAKLAAKAERLREQAAKMKVQVSKIQA